ncbi:MAG: hypothetical protein MJZ11_08235 [Lachnospiraceae bacterium]|nr:hypothetical protein [Lachnospiraceae bacterium]
MNIIGENNERHAMDVLSVGQRVLLETVCKEFDESISIQEINYETGYITFNYLYNRGTEHEFVKEDFMSVNVNCESTSCMMWEVVNAVYKKCV